MLREATPLKCVASVARPAEIEQLLLLLSWSEHAHLRFQLDHLPQLVRDGRILAISQGDRLSGIAYLTMDFPNCAVRGLIVRSGTQTGRVVDATMGQAVPEARSLSALSIGYIGDDDWLTPHLVRCGFSRVGQIIGLNRPGALMPASGNTSCVVRPAGPGDLPNLVASDWSAFEPLWRNGSETISSFLQQMPCFLVAVEAGQTLGYICGNAHARTGHIVRLAVRQEAQRQGIGTRLIHEALAWLSSHGTTSLSLNTQLDNRQSLSFYRSLGFYAAQAPTSVYRYPVPD
jgi:ribosomal protein S18 acetylase RimI-like enzyme